MRALPGLIGRRIAAALPAGAELEIAAPLKIEVPVRMAELIALGARFVELPQVPGGLPAALEARLDQAVKSAIGAAAQAAAQAPAKPPATVPPGPVAIAAPGAAAAVEPPRITVADALMAWYRVQELSRILALFSEASLETWYRALARSAAPPPAADAAADAAAMDAAVAAVRADAGVPAAPLASRAVLLRARLALAAAAAARLAIELGDARLIQAVERATPAAAPEPAAAAAPAAVAPAGVSAAKAAPAAPPPQPRAPRRRAPAQTEGERVLPSAVPFLLLGMLSRMGYLEVLGATLDALGETELWPVFAAALAFKVLDRPERGWRRTPASVACASAFAAIQGDIAEPDLLECARRLSASLDPVDAALAASLIKGHDAARPLILVQAGDGLLLLDADGLFPFEWSRQADGFSPVLAQLPDAIVLVPRAAANSGMLAALAAGGFRFLTDAPPLRGETWRRLDVPGMPRYWTNDLKGDPVALARNGTGLPDLADQADALWRELELRPGVPLAADTAFERSLFRAAASALGAIAWTLWHDREPVYPLLALNRFSSLEARVRFDASTVRIRLPLGRRQQDLDAAGLLRPVKDVPWYGGRTVEFSGG